MANINGKHYVRVLCDVRCEWKDQYPMYRVYINDELLTERTWLWRDHYLVENIQLELGAGKYRINFQLLEHANAVLSVDNMRVVEGPATVKKNTILRVQPNEMA